MSTPASRQRLQPHGTPPGSALQPTPSPGDVLADACARYADLVLLQLEALAAEDLEAFEQCAAAREMMADEINAAHSATGPVSLTGASPPGPAGPSTAAATAAAAAAQLARAAAADQLVLERLLALRAQAASALLEHDERRPRVLAYGSAAPRCAGSLDISL